MWVVKQNKKGEFFLTYDREARRNGRRGLWEFIGRQDSLEINRLISANQANGILCCKDDEGGVRAFVLGD